MNRKLRLHPGVIVRYPEHPTEEARAWDITRDPGDLGVILERSTAPGRTWVVLWVRNGDMDEVSTDWPGVLWCDELRSVLEHTGHIASDAVLAECRRRAVRYIESEHWPMSLGRSIE